MGRDKQTEIGRTERLKDGAIIECHIKTGKQTGTNSDRQTNTDRKIDTKTHIN